MCSNTLILNHDNWDSQLNRLKHYPIRLSQLKKLNSPLTMGELSLKYVVEGEELYSNNKEDFHLKQHQFLLGNNNQHCEISINAKEIDTGLCMDLDLNLFKQALSEIIKPDELDNQDIQNWFLTGDLFMSSNTASESLRLYLNAIASAINKGNFDNRFNIDEVQSEVLKHIVQSQLPLIQSYHRINAIKSTTRKELLKRLLVAKTYMDDHFVENISIQDLSKICLIAEYRFFHLFKSVYHISPYQYMLKKKMTKAKELYNGGKYNWTEIAIKMGYDNLSSFSKAYKKYFGVSAQFDYSLARNVSF